MATDSNHIVFPNQQYPGVSIEKAGTGTLIRSLHNILKEKDSKTIDVEATGRFYDAIEAELNARFASQDQAWFDQQQDVRNEYEKDKQR